jgi:hypothetical protein
MLSQSSRAHDLIRAGRGAYTPSDADRARVADALRARLGEAALPADVSSAPIAASAGHATRWLVVSGFGCAALAIGALFFVRPGNPVPGNGPGSVSRSATLADSALPSEPATLVVTPLPTLSTEPQTGTAAPVPAQTHPLPSPTSARRSQDRLAEEVSILSRAARDLHAGRPAKALDALDDYRHKFPKGILNEDQFAARVQAFCALGKFNEAEAELARHPSNAPAALSAKEFCDVKSGKR